MRTLKVHNIDWDLHIDQNGNIETTDGLGAIAQTVANKIQLFTKDAYFYQDKGIPHFVVDLGRNLPLSLARSEYRQAAMATEGVKSVEINISKNASGRYISGEITLKTDLGTAAVQI